MKAKKIAVTGLTVAMSMAMLAGCGPKSEATTTTTVTIAFDTDLSSMDNSIATDGSSFSMQLMGLSGLLALDESGTPVPDLAESYDVSDDGLTYTFHLKKDAQWSNGTPITAHDVVYSWHRLASPALASEYAFILDTMHVVNASEVIAGTKDAKELGVKAVDDNTVEVSLTLPCSFLPSLMAFPPLFPLNEEYVTSQGDQYALSPENMIYSGQYVMTDWKQGNEYTFEKNDKYVNADDAKDKADTVVFKFIQDTQAAMLSYQNGDIDAVKLQGEQVDEYSSQEGFTNRLQGYLWYLSINFNNPVFQNANLRIALSYAANPEARWKDFQDAEKILVQQDHGVIPIYQNGGAMMINPKVSGIRFHSGGVDDYRWMVVSQ